MMYVRYLCLLPFLVVICEAARQPQQKLEPVPNPQPADGTESDEKKKGAFVKQAEKHEPVDTKERAGSETPDRNHKNRQQLKGTRSQKMAARRNMMNKKKDMLGMRGMKPSQMSEKQMKALKGMRGMKPSQMSEKQMKALKANYKHQLPATKRGRKLHSRKNKAQSGNAMEKKETPDKN